MINYKTTSIYTALIAFTLFTILIFLPEVLFWIFGVEQINSAFFVGRRMAMLFLGLAILLWVGRNAAHSESRQAICLSVGVSMCALAGLGVFELLQGHAGPGILLAIFTEFVIAGLYFKLWLEHQNTEQNLGGEILPNVKGE